MKFIRTYEEIKYTEEQKKLVSKVRYRLNKFFGGRYCGVSKVRTIVINNPGLGAAYVPYEGDSIMFNIHVPSFIVGAFLDEETYKKKIDAFTKVADRLNLEKRYEYSEDRIATEEQLKNLLFDLNYIDIFSDSDKYNL